MKQKYVLRLESEIHDQVIYAIILCLTSGDSGGSSAPHPTPLLLFPASARAAHRKPGAQRGGQQLGLLWSRVNSLPPLSYFLPSWTW